MIEGDAGRRGVLFDLDGLLIDSEVLWSASDRDFLEDRGVVPGDEIKSLVMGTTVLESAAAMKRAYGLSGTPASIARERLERVGRLYRERLDARPGAGEVLGHLPSRGYRLALATASPRILVDVVFERFPWRDRFDAVATGDDVERGKPAPDLFLLAARGLGISPGRCVVIEDAPAGVAAARAAGMRSVAVPDPRYHEAHELPADRVLASLEDLTFELLNELLDGRTRSPRT